MSIENQITDILNEFDDELEAEAKKAFKDTGRDTSKTLRSTSPRGSSNRHYAEGWTYKVTGNGLNQEVVIYNKTKPGLTHLLENGHQKFDWHGKNHGRTRAIKHIEPAQQKATEELLTRLSK